MLMIIKIRDIISNHFIFFFIIIIKIISVISDIYNTTYNNRDKFWKLTTPDHHDIFSEIYIELIKKYYYTLGHLKNPNSDSD